MLRTWEPQSDFPAECLSTPSSTLLSATDRCPRQVIREEYHRVRLTCRVAESMLPPGKPIYRRPFDLVADASRHPERLYRDGMTTAGAYIRLFFERRSVSWPCLISSHGQTDVVFKGSRTSGLMGKLRCRRRSCAAFTTIVYLVACTCPLQMAHGLSK